MAKAVVKQFTLSEAMAKMEKDYGKGAVILGNQIISDYDAIDTGSIGLNHAIGIGGIPATGKVIEIYGWESSGKSTLCQHIVANAQAKYKKEGSNKKCLYIDGENSIDTKYATAIGIDLKDLIIVQLDEGAGEAAYNKMEALVKTGEIGLVVIDSYNSLQPKKIVEGLMGEASMGVHARMQGQAVMKSNSLAKEFGTTFIWIGQLREKIGVMFGSPETTQGGNALKFYTHLRIEVRRSTTKDNSTYEGDVKLGNQVTFKVIKNKVGMPFKKATVNMRYGLGIDKFDEIISLCKNYDLIKLRAGIITYNEIKYEQEDFKKLIINNEDFKDELIQNINNKLQEDIFEPVPENETVFIKEQILIENTEIENEK